MKTTISLGKPITAPVLIPVKHRATPMCINHPFMINGECHRVTAISFGTPHGAVFVSDVDTIDVAAIGEALGSHALFPLGASIVFVQVTGRNSLKARLWQQGEGEINFTEEAICVAGTAAMMCQKILFSEVDIDMGGEIFRVEWNRGGGEVCVTGDRESFLSGSKADQSYSREIGAA